MSNETGGSWVGALRMLATGSVELKAHDGTIRRERWRRAVIWRCLRPFWTYTAFTKECPNGCRVRRGTNRAVMISPDCREHFGADLHDIWQEVKAGHDH